MPSKIEWTDETWNPVTGCTKVSPGCAHCYAKRLWAKTYPGRAFGDVRMHEDRLVQPLHWRKPRKVFVCSMGDLFHKDVPTEFIWRVFSIMRRAEQHTFQVLTKRPERMASVVEEMLTASCCDPAPNIWVGTSVEDQASLDTRAEHLLLTPAAKRFISYEPALGPINPLPYLPNALCEGGLVNRLDWIVCGGESGGVDARPMNPDWPRLVRNQCQSVGVPFFFKQWGAWCPCDILHDQGCGIRMPGPVMQFGEGEYSISGRGAMMTRCGKKRAGRLLDGREWNEMPEAHVCQAG